MRTLLHVLASLSLKLKLHSGWYERWPDGWLVELLDLDLDYTRDMDFGIEDSHFPYTKKPFVWTHSTMLSLTVLNFTLDITVGWETES